MAVLHLVIRVVNMRFRKDAGLSCDDVLLVPQHSDIASRDDVDLSTKLGNLKLKLPLLSSNMDTVTEGDMAVAMHNAGGAGVLHRFAEHTIVQVWLNQCRDVDAPRIASFGLGDDDLFLATNNPKAFDAICIDVAHGDHQRVVDMISKVRARRPELDIIAGNVATGKGAMRLVEAGANIVKVGVGGGSVCSTRVVSGHGMPTLQSVLDVCKELSHLRLSGREEIFIIADGGARYPGDIVKYLAAGADAVMLGSLLAGTDEAPGARIVEQGLTYKTFRGMASLDAQNDKRSGLIILRSCVN
jgi:IMP dehydrogenase